MILAETKKPKKKPNWIKIRTEYETTDTSYRELVKKHGVPRTTLEARAKREAWSEAKNITSANIEAKTRQKTIEKVSDIDSETIALALIAKKLSVEKAIGLVNDSEILRMDDLYTLNRIAIAVEKLKHDRSKIDIELQKLELEKAKAEKEEKEDKEVRVVLEGDLEVWGG